MAATKRVSKVRRALEKAERELEKCAERERERVAREEALLTRLCLLERAYEEMQNELSRAKAKSKARTSGLNGRFGRPPARLLRAVEADQPADSNAVVMVAAHLARAGHSRAEVKSFLMENFEQIDIGSTLATVFADGTGAKTAQA